MKDGNWAALFDLDGVVVDTETQYTAFWNKVGKLYYPNLKDFGRVIKGQTLTQIYETYFQGMTAEQQYITQSLRDFEKAMTFEYIPGVDRFMDELRKEGVKMAIVTSSDDRKMQRAYLAHPELKGKVDCIVTANQVSHSKPHPECFLKAAERLQMSIEQCVVFEDSLSGLEAGMRSGMKVVGLSTTNSKEAISGRCHLIIENFQTAKIDIVKGLIGQK